MIDHRFPFGAKIPWARGVHQTEHWNEVAAWSIETFGLPGDRFYTDLNILDMTWWFKTSEDRMIFILRNGSSQCIDLAQTTLTS